ncbi:hypothetical protein NXC14_PC00599 (plasmid) [Rhizobium sp. NXC14]|uniref:hypothetical protein n=1 Tax=Rhizobium sp. NXC14 TaxID=1981173 RepID=UPI000A203075|nr:hypothetical protein [Rhizobium sp. NXC14]ARO34134.1 hypothetical protein NXC14_PC00599 [Rhizobium sp. NXC14]
MTERAGFCRRAYPLCARTIRIEEQAAIAMEALRTAGQEGVAYGRCICIALPSGETRWFELSVARRPSADPTTATTILAFSREPKADIIALRLRSPVGGSSPSEMWPRG